MRHKWLFGTLFVLLVGACSAPPPPETKTAVSPPPPAPAATPTDDTPATYSMVDATEPGERLAMAITVQDAVNGQPIPQAELWLRQTSDAGLYEEDAEGRPRIEVTAWSDDNGRLNVESIVPGRYPNDPTASRHIHLTIEAEGYDSQERVILFDNDPYLTPEERAFALGLVVPMSQDENGVWQTDLLVEMVPLDAEAFSAFTVVAEQSTAVYQVEETFLDRADWLEAHGLTAGLATAVGGTNEISGTLQLDLTQTPPAVGDNRFVVNLMGLTSDQEGRDNMVRREIWENGRFGTASFVIHSLSNFSDSQPDLSANQPVDFTMTGDLTIREITRTVPFNVTARLVDEQLVAEATTQFSMSEFGITPPDLLGIVTVSDRVTILLNLLITPAS